MPESWIYTNLVDRAKQKGLTIGFGIGPFWYEFSLFAGDKHLKTVRSIDSAFKFVDEYEAADT